jgi:hypothetical protein
MVLLESASSRVVKEYSNDGADSQELAVYLVLVAVALTILVVSLL